MSGTILIACEVVVEELRLIIPEDLPVRVIDPILHLQPEKLRAELQKAIDEEEKRYDTLLLGFGLCSRAVEGLKSTTARIVVPRVDDCIGMFLGSCQAYLNRMSQAPGTFFLSQGWVRAGLTPFEEYNGMVDRFGPERADRLMKVMLNHYRRLGYIDTGFNLAGDEQRSYAREQADRFDLVFEEIAGSGAMLDALLNGTFDDNFLVIEPGGDITYQMFFTSEE